MKSESICLSDEERKFLKVFVKKGEKKARSIARANVLLLLDSGSKTNEVSKTTGLHRQSIWRIRRRYLSEGLAAALEEKTRPGQPRRYTDKEETEIIALACTDPPEGMAKWSIVLLTGEVRKNGIKISRETVRLILKKRHEALAEEVLVHTEDRRRVQDKNVRHS